MHRSVFKSINSQVGRKYISGITGIGLIVFLVEHLIGNLTIFGAPDAFNEYVQFLHNFGPLLYVAELGLFILFLYHSVLGISIWWNRRRARPQQYAHYTSSKSNSHQTLASRSMIYTGIITLTFLVLHLAHFKFGTVYTTTLNGEEVRDLKRLVVESFTNPLVAFSYVFVLGMLILHLSHGFWSACTSLGMQHNGLSKKIQLAGYGFAILLMMGFMFIPLYIWLTAGEGLLIEF